MEKIVRVFESPEAADDADLDEWLAMTPEERLMIGVALSLEAYGNPPEGLVRILRLADHEED